MLDMGHSVIRNAFDKRQRNLKVQEEIDGVIAWTAGNSDVFFGNMIAVIRFAHGLG